MTKKKRLWLLFTCLHAIVQVAWSWEGSGTANAPYLLANSADWKQLADDVSEGNSYSGKYFRLTADIDANGVSVGTENRSFSGTLDGNNHTLTFNRGTVGSYADGYNAPFTLLSGATIRNLQVQGTVYSAAKYAAGIACFVDGDKPATFADCSVLTRFYGSTALGGEANFGGFVALLKPSCTGALSFRHCSFLGSFGSYTSRSACFVGYASVPLSFQYCVVDPIDAFQKESSIATFVRTPQDVSVSLTQCYYTKPCAELQGSFAFTEVTVPEGCTAKMVSEPVLKLMGRQYYTSGTQVSLSVPEGTPFNHWVSSGSPVGCFVSDPWTATGLHTLSDVRSQPVLSIATAMPQPYQADRKRFGIIYRYLTDKDYLLFMSDSLRAARGYQFDSDGECFVYDADHNKTYITVVWGCDPSEETFQNYYRDGWLWNAKAYEGCIITNDLVATFWDHTHLFAIAPRAFQNVKQMKRILFTSDQYESGRCNMGLDVIIGEQAFKDSGLEELVMVYRNQKARQWEILTPASSVTIAADAFQGTSGQIAVDPNVYQDFASSPEWAAHRGRFSIYAAKVQDMSVNGAVYSYWRNSEGTPLKNSNDAHSTLLQTLRYWNADYQQFSAASLLTSASENIWYTQVVGADDSYLESNNGLMRIYNDPGSYYNYKTIAIQSLGGSKKLKAVEFWQTNGRSENSFSDLKVVIRNGAFKDCTNLTEFRLFYFAEDGDNHWEALGPQDVIPGDNIFGLGEGEELATSGRVSSEFRILVSPDRYQDFLVDPNWLPYVRYIEPAYPPQDQKDDYKMYSTIKDYVRFDWGVTAFLNDKAKAVTYGYINSPGGILLTSQTVSQDVSWFTAPVIAAEVALVVAGVVGIPGIAVHFNPLLQMISAEAWWEGLSAETIATLAQIHSTYYQTILGLGALADYRATDFRNSLSALPAASASVNTAANVSVACWGGRGTYNPDAMRKGMRANLLSNIHQVGLVGAGFVLTTPQKNLVYHTYIKEVHDSIVYADIYAGTDKNQGSNASARTMTIAKRAFHNKKLLEKVSFRENNVSTNESLPMILTLPDSLFMGCNNLREFRLLLQTESSGTRALGPENFILAGDSVFAGLSPDKFHIVIDPRRKQDFLDSESWAPLERFFVYEPARPEVEYNEYGGGYAYAYDGTLQKVHKVAGHKIEHTVVVAPDDQFLQMHQGALKLCNDIGAYNNYQLDAVGISAFRGNPNLRVVNFTDLKGAGAYGDTYTGLDMVLQDSCFANCANLKDFDLIYLVTDGTNHIEPLTPRQVKIGRGVFDGTKVRIKMMPQQEAWFLADSSWTAYKDRFSPCIIQPADKGIKKVLAPMCYRDLAHIGYDPDTWDDYIDLSRLADAGFSWLDGRFQAQADNIRSFTEFKYFESLGLVDIRQDWFKGLTHMTSIQLPSTTENILTGAFANCAALREIELPEKVRHLYDNVFSGCASLQTVVVRAKTPAKLDVNVFPKNRGMKIYVPAESLDAYLTAWAEYKDYIVSLGTYHVDKVVTLTRPDELAEKLGLTVEFDYSGLVYGSQPRYIHGQFVKYDSLTVSGPLGNLDLAVIRYLAGCDAYEADGQATGGQLRYLNLYNADIRKTSDGYTFYNDGYAMSGQRYDIHSDNQLPDFLFTGCTALETVVLPRTLTKIGVRLFARCSGLKRVAIGGNISSYDDWTYSNGLIDYPLEELVFCTETAAKSDSRNPWEYPIGTVYTKQSQQGDYLNQLYLIKQARSITAPFADDAVMETLAEKGEFFPSVYLGREHVDTIFSNSSITSFDDFYLFQNVKSLFNTFSGCSGLRRITLPASVKEISSGAFAQCLQLDTIRMLSDSVPVLASKAFDSLPRDFRILVPSRRCKLYRAKWAEYADHIFPDNGSWDGADLVTVTVTEPNTLAEALGLKKVVGHNALISSKTQVIGLSGNYGKVKKLKVVGPISGIDFDVMRYLAGYCPWAHTRNYAGQLEYIDLYDARIVESNGYVDGETSNFDNNQGRLYGVDNDVLPYHAFLKAYCLKTLILPRTCKAVTERALQECESLEQLVVGDDMEDFNWNALDDDIALTRMYLLSKKKTAISMEAPVWRWLCNNYNPTFDAFYVRPSLLQDYLTDSEYTGYSWQRTNNISTGLFTDDDSFCAFAAHAVATQDDLAGVKSVKGWFSNYPGVSDLTCLAYTSVDSLHSATLAPLKQLRCIALPATLRGMDKDLFSSASRLRYADFMLCDSFDVVAGLRDGGLARMGINTQQTLVYVPGSYGDTHEVNVITNTGGVLRTKNFHMEDSLDYLVPYAFQADTILNSRQLVASAIPYTVCVPYKLDVPSYARAYKLSSRDGNNLVFEEVEGQLQPMQPYLLKVVGNRRLRRMSTTLNTSIQQTVPANGVQTYGRQDDVLGYSLRGTFGALSNKEAAELGAYILQSDGDWHPVSTADAKAVIRPFRAYLLPGTRSAGARVGMTLKDGEVSDIEAIETVDADGTRRYYDLNGRELQGKPAKGMYMYNGKKYLAK